MANEMNLEIARKCFASLVLDHEWKGCPELKLKPAVYCRVLVDGWYVDAIYAPNREVAIEKFMSKNWRRL